MAKRRPPSTAPVHLRVTHRDRGLDRDRLRCDLGRKTAGYTVTEDRAMATCPECLDIDERVRAREEARDPAAPTREQQLAEALRRLVDALPRCSLLHDDEEGVPFACSNHATHGGVCDTGDGYACMPCRCKTCNPVAWATPLRAALALLDGE